MQWGDKLTLHTSHEACVYVWTAGCALLGAGRSPASLPPWRAPEVRWRSRCRDFGPNTSRAPLRRRESRHQLCVGQASPAATAGGGAHQGVRGQAQSILGGRLGQPPVAGTSTRRWQARHAPCSLSRRTIMPPTRPVPPTCIIHLSVKPNVQPFAHTALAGSERPSPPALCPAHLLLQALDG